MTTRNKTVSSYLGVAIEEGAGERHRCSIAAVGTAAARRQRDAVRRHQSPARDWQH